MFDTPIIQKCLHPVRIKDTVHGGYMYVPCGHCEACRTSYRNKWMQRIHLECESSASVLFFTLTYDNAHVPLLSFSDDGLRLISNRSHDDDLDLSYSDIDMTSCPALSTSLYTTNQFCFSYCCKSDVQKFLKRLRRRLDYDRKGLLSSVDAESRKFRYFICSEYGPKTFRAHYHGLLFFDDKRTADAVKSCYLYESWRLCSPDNLDCSEVNSSAPTYVAKYVSCDSSLPPILQTSVTATFHLASRFPAIGCKAVDFSHLSDQVESSTLTYDTVNITKDGVQSVSLPYPSAVVNYFFPKPMRFSCMDYNELLSFFNKSLQFSKLDSVCSMFKRCVIRTYHIGDYDPFRCHVIKYSDVVGSMSDDEFSFGIPQNSLCLKRCAYFCTHYNISVDYYLHLLLKCYAVRSSDSMKAMYDFQNYCVDRHYSYKQIAYMCSPDLVNSLPRFFNLIGLDRLRYFDLLLQSYNCCCRDFYDEHSERINLNALDVRNTSFFVDFIAYLTDQKVKFDKVRNINHFNNLNSQSYESF